eukprot:768707-Hanusia_phi.AAC.4
MQLLEIIPHAATDEKVIATAVQLGLKQGKLPIVCKDVPGFFVNRLPSPSRRLFVLTALRFLGAWALTLTSRWCSHLKSMTC